MNYFRNCKVDECICPPLANGVDLVACEKSDHILAYGEHAMTMTFCSPRGAYTFLFPFYISSLTHEELCWALVASPGREKCNVMI